MTICFLTLPEIGLIWLFDCKTLWFHQFPIILSTDASPLNEDPLISSFFVSLLNDKLTNFSLSFWIVLELYEISWSLKYFSSPYPSTWKIVAPKILTENFIWLVTIVWSPSLEKNNNYIQLIHHFWIFPFLFYYNYYSEPYVLKKLRSRILKLK